MKKIMSIDVMITIDHPHIPRTFVTIERAEIGGRAFTNDYEFVSDASLRRLQRVQREMYQTFDLRGA